MKGPMVQLTEPYPHILRYENKLYAVDEECKAHFHVDAVCMINVCEKEEGLYTMFYVREDGTVAETWHDRWKPDLQTIIDMVQKNHKEVLQKQIGDHDEAISILTPVLHVSQKMVLELGAAGCASVQEATVGNSRMQRKAKLLETALLSALELMDMEMEAPAQSLACITAD